MAPPLSDAVVVDVLRRVDRLTTPLVRRLGRPPETPQAEREQWWAAGVSRVAARASAVPRLAGKLAERVPPLLARAPGAYADDVLGDREDRSAVRTLWRVSQLLGRIDDTLDARPK